jgi:hypothetical protein
LPLSPTPLLTPPTTMTSSRGLLFVFLLSPCVRTTYATYFTPLPLSLVQVIERTEITIYKLLAGGVGAKPHSTSRECIAAVAASRLCTACASWARKAMSSGLPRTTSMSS